MAGACSTPSIELCPLRTPLQSPQRGELMMMFENLISNVFSHGLQNQIVNEAEPKEISENGIEPETKFQYDAIDAKIKDALQIMKTSLSFAIREEVDILKEKVADLESKIAELKTENRLLREYAPEDVLRQLEESASPSVTSPVFDRSSAAGTPIEA